MNNIQTARCQGWTGEGRTCPEPCTHVSEKGAPYCTFHAKRLARTRGCHMAPPAYPGDLGGDA